VSEDSAVAEKPFGDANIVSAELTPTAGSGSDANQASRERSHLVSLALSPASHSIALPTPQRALPAPQYLIMAAQQIQFRETIRAMKVAMKRNRAASPTPSSSASDSDDQHMHTNRGNKLKRSARYVRSGCLDTTGGAQVYKRRVNHAGYSRNIISKKPRLYDEDGDVVDPADLPSDMDEEEVAMYGEAVHEDPFGGVRLEDLLRPLASAAELAEHPGLSVAYTSKALTQMAEEAAEMVRREKASLWRAKRLLQRFRGDGAWMGCGVFESGHDEVLLRDGDVEVGSDSAVPSIVETEAGGTVRTEGSSAVEAGPSAPEEVNGELMDGIDAQDHVAGAQAAEQSRQPQADEQHARETIETANGTLTHLTSNTIDEPTATNRAINDLATREEEDKSSNSGTSNPSAPSHRMTTRARARSPQPPASPSPSPSDSASIPSVHPWFIPPPSCLPDRDLGLPAQEAEETRRLLMLYVQKQENVVRQLETLYTGLQKTDRLRQDVWRACKAEGHMIPDGKGGVMTEMSDGEDWYDVEEWGLQPRELKDGVELEKGKDEVEDAAEEEGRRVGGRRRRVVGR